MKQSIKMILLLSMSFSILLLSACGDTTNSNSDHNKQQDVNNGQIEQKKGEADSPALEVNGSDDSYPKTVMVNDEEVTINEKPKRIAVLSLDAAEAVLEIGGAEHVVAVPNSSIDSALAYQAEKAAKVEHRITSATSLDPEQVLSFESDLLIMTKVHHAEQDADQILQQAGIPLISLNTWSTLEHVWANYVLIGEAIGEKEKAQQIISEMKENVKAVQAAVEGATKPSVLVISPLGPGTGPYFIGSSNISYDIVRLAGGHHSADDLGLTRVTKASMEQIIKTDPEYILLIQWKEGDTADLEAITATAGWQTLQAVEKGNVKTMTVKQIFYPNRYNVDSLEEIAKWLHPDRF